MTRRINDDRTDPPDADLQHSFPRFLVNLKLVPVKSRWGRAEEVRLMGQVAQVATTVLQWVHQKSTKERLDLTKPV